MTFFLTSSTILISLKVRRMLERTLSIASAEGSALPVDDAGRDGTLLQVERGMPLTELSTLTSDIVRPGHQRYPS